MPQQKFARLTLDIDTYDKLTTLAHLNKLTRAAYVRRQIRSQCAESDIFAIVESIKTIVFTSKEYPR